MYDSTTENTVLNHISEGLLGTLQRMTEVACVYKPRECQLIQHNIPGLTFTKIFFCSQHLNGVILTEIKYPCFVQKNSAGRESLYRVRKPGAFLSSCEVTCVYGLWHMVKGSVSRDKKWYQSRGLPFKDVLAGVYFFKQAPSFNLQTFIIGHIIL